MEINLG